MFDAQERQQLAAWLRDRFRASDPGTLLGAGYQATVHLYRTPFGDVVVKRAHRSPVLGGLGRRAIRREHRVYERLAGIAGVPRAFGLLDEQCLVLEHIAGKPLRGSETILADPAVFFAELLRALEAMHRAGVAHGDLKRKDNILVGDDGRPFVIDFGVACLERRPARWWNRMLFNWFRQADYNAWIKLKYRGRNVEAMSPEDRRRYRPLALERVARWVRIPWQKLTLRRLRKRRQRERNARP